MSELLDRCRAYGADVEGTMERFVGDEDLFAQCLQVFTEDPGFAGLKESVENGDYTVAFEHAHALKGVAGNLGLTPLFSAISNLVEALRVNDYSNVEAQYAEIETEKAKAFALLQA